MSFAAELDAGRFVVALEITPPRQPRPRVLLRRAGLLGTAVRAINVIQRPERQSSLNASLALGEAGLNPVWHLVNRGRTRQAIAADLAVARAGGIRQVLCIRGDHAGWDTADTPPIRELVAQVRAGLPEALIGATLNQHAADRRAVLRNLLPKLTAGAGYVQTQPVFDVDALRPLAEQVRGTAPGTKVVPMVMPLLTRAAAVAVEARLGIGLPDALIRRLEQGGAEAGWQAFGETIAALVATPWADGVAIMTYEIDPDAEMGRRIVAMLEATVTKGPPSPALRAPARRGRGKTDRGVVTNPRPGAV